MSTSRLDRCFRIKPQVNEHVAADSGDMHQFCLAAYFLVLSWVTLLSRVTRIALLCLLNALALKHNHHSILSGATYP